MKRVILTIALVICLCVGFIKPAQATYVGEYSINTGATAITVGSYQSEYNVVYVVAKSGTCSHIVAVQGISLRTYFDDYSDDFRMGPYYVNFEGFSRTISMSNPNDSKSTPIWSGAGFSSFITPFSHTQTRVIESGCSSVYEDFGFNVSANYMYKFMECVLSDYYNCKLMGVPTVYYRQYTLTAQEVSTTNNNGKIQINCHMDNPPFPVYYRVHDVTNGNTSPWFTETSPGANDASWVDTLTTSGGQYVYNIDYCFFVKEVSYMGKYYKSWDNINLGTVILDASPPTSTMTVPEYSNTKAVTITNTNPGNDATHVRYSLNGTNWSAWDTFASTKTYTVPAEGTYTIYAQYKDAMGNISSASISDTVIVDTTVPIGSLATATGSNFVNNMTDLITTASDTNSVTHMMIALTSDFSGVSWQSYDGVSSIAIPGADGAYTIYAKYKDIAGNVSPVYTANVIKDTIEPSNCTIELQGKEGITGETKSQSITVVASGTDDNGLSGIQVSNDNSSWSPMCSTIVNGEYQYVNYLLPSGRGIKTVYVRIYDNAGNYSIASDTIKYDEDTVLPTCSMVINNGASYTIAPAVSIAVTANDNATFTSSLQYRLSNDGLHWSEYANFASSVDWNIITGAGGTDTEGTKTVYLNVKDESGNVGYAVASISYSTSKPVISNNPLQQLLDNCTDSSMNVTTGEIDGEQVYLCKKNIAYVPLGLDNSTTYYRVAAMDGDWGEWKAYDPLKAHELTLGLGEGLIKLRVQGKNTNGALSDEHVIRFLVDHTNPIINSMTGLNGATATKVNQVSLMAEVEDNLSPQIWYRYMINSGAWSTLQLLGESGETNTFNVTGCVQGLNNIVAEFSDLNGNSKSKSINIFGIQ